MKKTVLYFILGMVCAELICNSAGAQQFSQSIDISSSPNVVGSGARAMGMGGAFIAVADDATAASWNPAGLGGVVYRQLSFNHVRWMEDIQFNHIGYVHPVAGQGTYGLSVTHGSSGDIPRAVVNEYGTYIGDNGSYKATDLCCSASYGRISRDGRKFFGMNAKYIRMEIDGYSAGTYAADIGLLAATGCPEVRVYRKLRVAFFSTGDELRSVGDTLGEGQIYDSNRYLLHSMLTRLNVEIHDLGVIEDDKAAIAGALKQAASGMDVILTSGGVSVGDADYVKQVLDEIGTVNFWRVAMKPGKPIAIGTIGNCYFY